MNREQRRKIKNNNSGEIKQLMFIINTLEDFNKMTDSERNLSIEELKKELEKLRG